MSLQSTLPRGGLDPRAGMALVAYTAVVWVGRTRNVLADDDLGGFDRLWRLGVVVIFLGLAAAVVARWRDRKLVLGILCLWTAGYWLIRGTGILIDDYSAGFKAIHTLLAAVSVALAAWAWPGRRFGPQ